MLELDTPGKRLRFARKRAGFEEQIDFYRTNEIPQATYNLHENGKRRISPPEAEKYARLLGNCSPEWLLYGKGTGPSGAAADAAPITQAEGESEEMAAFMLLYDRLSVLTKNNEKASRDQVGLVPRLYGFESDARGTVQLTFFLWNQIINEKSNLPLRERVLERLASVEVGMGELAEALRKIVQAIKGDAAG